MKKKERDRCLDRDKCCVVTHAANPDVCHVFPFAAKRNLAQTGEALSSLEALWGSQLVERMRKLLAGKEEIIDTPENMIALEPLIHRWWGKAIIGFEPVGVIEKGVRLRMRWLKATGKSVGDVMPLDTDPRDLLRPYSDPMAGTVGRRHSKSGRPIVDGQIIDIISDGKTPPPSMEILSLQWDLIRMASLCGAAEAVEYDPWNPDDDDPFQEMKAFEEESEFEERDAGVTMAMPSSPALTESRPTSITTPSHQSSITTPSASGSEPRKRLVLLTRPSAQVSADGNAAEQTPSRAQLSVEGKVAEKAPSQAPSPVKNVERKFLH